MAQNSRVCIFVQNVNKYNKQVNKSNKQVNKSNKQVNKGVSFRHPADSRDRSLDICL